ncbi:hypothetical protein COO60DRAFT_516632 [Scenedesmus sp. NREL 46B-D3]|nr:hypothetical protein COO60DRAFT_516632 [Scenedesmus sp. NREL 46B-D3]
MKYQLWQAALLLPLLCNCALVAVRSVGCMCECKKSNTERRTHDCTAEEMRLLVCMCGVWGSSGVLLHVWVVAIGKGCQFSASLAAA